MIGELSEFSFSGDHLIVFESMFSSCDINNRNKCLTAKLQIFKTINEPWIEISNNLTF